MRLRVARNRADSVHMADVVEQRTQRGSPNGVPDGTLFETWYLCLMFETSLSERAIM